MFSKSRKTLFILMGIQASGKSTFAHTVLTNCVYISLDQLHTRNKERIALQNALQTGRNCVIDNTNPIQKERQKYIDLAQKSGYKTVGIYFRSAVAECSVRNDKRLGKAHVPLKGLLATAKRLEQPTSTEGFDALYYVKIENNEFIISNWDETL